MAKEKKQSTYPEGTAFTGGVIGRTVAEIDTAVAVPQAVPENTPANLEPNPWHDQLYANNKQARDEKKRK
jgi:hypothetical protein